MELIYSGKKTEDAIIKQADSYKKAHFDETENSILIKADAFSAMASLANNFSGKIDLVYFDPPQNGFMAAGADRAKLKNEDYIEFIRERLVVAKRLLSDKGSIYIHVSSAFSHTIKLLCDEIFGEKNFKNDITRLRSNPRNSNANSYGNQKDTILFYACDGDNNIWNDVKIPLDEEEYSDKFNKVDGLGRKYATVPLHAPGETKSGATGENWRGISLPKGRHWMTSPEELDRLDSEGRIEWSQSGNPRLIVFAYEYEGKRIQDIWNYKDPLNSEYPSERNAQMLDLIIRQSSLKGSTVLDCFAGSGVFLRCAESLKRRYIGIDCSTESIDMIKAKASRSLDYYDMESGYKQSFLKEHTEQLSFFDEE